MIKCIKWVCFVVVGGLCGLSLVGCEDPEVKKYTAPREKVERDFTRLESYKVPEGWARMAKPVELSLASFQIGEGDKKVVMTITRFPGKAGGLTANIERWRGKVGLPPLKEEQAGKDMLSLNMDGQKTPYVDLANPEKKGSDRILGVVAERGAVTWFFKMQGPPEQVGQQKAAFEAFVESVKFGGTGAKDG